MKVFLSWSGNRSRAIAEVLKGWLPSVLQAARPYFSPDDVTKGARWLTEISKELEDSRIALLIITPENQEAPWLLFEAGALSKNFDRSRVCPLLFGGMDPADVKGPLVQFQGAKFCRVEMKKVLKAVNTELGDSSLSSEVLDNVFEMWWPKLEEQVAEKLEEFDESGGVTKRSDRELLEEVLALTRRTASIDHPGRISISHPAMDDLLIGVVDLVKITRERAPNEDTLRASRRILKPLEYLIHRAGGARSSERLHRVLSDLEELSDPLTSVELDRRTIPIVEIDDTDSIHGKEV
jgi:hypothetical protein